MKNALIFLGLSALWWVSCKKQIAAPVAHAPSSLTDAFDFYWNGMNANYVYWDIDTVNWLQVQKNYRPLFSSLNISDSSDLRKAAHYFSEIADRLVDRHYRIQFSSPVLEDSIINPGYDHLVQEPDYRPALSYMDLDRKRLDSGYVMGIENTGGDNGSLIALSGTINGAILFFSCNQFALYRAYQNQGGQVLSVLQYFFARLANPARLNGIIIDLRDNPGGDLGDLNFFCSQFIAGPLLFGYSRYKIGSGAEDYTPWISANIGSSMLDKPITVPIILLVDRYSASLAEIITMTLRTLPNCRVVGENTYGATGPLAENNIYNDGSFNVTGFMSVTTSSAEFKYIDGKMYEGKGFPPDIRVEFDRAAVSNGYDAAMDTVIKNLP
jgi:carboxyl-terminal processing protease